MDLRLVPVELTEPVVVPENAAVITSVGSAAVATTDAELLTVTAGPFSVTGAEGGGVSACDDPVQPLSSWANASPSRVDVVNTGAAVAAVAMASVANAVAEAATSA